MKRYEFNLTMNTRDLGGYMTKYGKKTKFLSFIRSDALTFITEKDKQFLIENNITLSIDMRTTKVISNIPSPFIDDPRFEYHNFPIIEGSGIPLTDENASELYLKMLSNHKTFYDIFSLIASTNKNIIFNCTAGKDRTGMLSCLLLLLAGVSEKDILNDYEISTKFIYENIDKIRKEHPSFPENLGYSKRKYLENFLKLFFEKYKTVENYLYLIGLNENQINQIKNKLI